MKKVLVLLSIGIVMLIILFFNIDLENLVKIISEMSFEFILVTFLILLAFNTLKSIRWRIIVGHGSFFNFFAISHIGSLVTNFLPSYVQEPLKVALLKKKENIEYGYGISSILIERLMDVLGLLLIGAVTSLLFSTTTEIHTWVFQMMKDIVVFVSLLSGFFIFLILKPHLFSKLFSPFQKYRYLSKIYTKIEILLPELSIALKEISKKPFTLIVSFLITIFMWVISSFAIYLLFYSIGYEIEPLSALFGFVTLSLAMILPQSPGFVGTFEIIWVGIFSQIISDETDGIVAVGVVYHLILILYNFILGFIGMLLLKLSFKDILFTSKQKP